MLKRCALLFFVLPGTALAAGAPSIDAMLFIQNSPYLAVIGLALIILEFMLPTKGVLGLLGVVGFVLGTFALAHEPDPALRLDWPAIITLNILVIGTFLATMYATIRGYTRRNPQVVDPLLNSEAVVADWHGHAGRVKAGGALWQAVAATPGENFTPGDRVTVTGRNNLTLTITATKEI